MVNFDSCSPICPPKYMGGSCCGLCLGLRHTYQLPCSSPALTAVSRLAAPRLNGDARTSACLMGRDLLFLRQSTRGSTRPHGFLTFWIPLTQGVVVRFRWRHSSAAAIVAVHRSPRGGCLHERQGTSIMTGVPMQARCGLACVGGSYPPQGGLHHRSDPFTVASMRTLLSALVCPFL